MLTTDNLIALLGHLGFEATGAVKNAVAYLALARSKAAKAINQANVNATAMRTMQVPVPPLAEQKRLVAKVRKLEQQIAEALAVIAAAPARKQAIFRKYL